MARTTKIRNVVLDEVSFVGKGDNPEAHVLLLKMKKDPTEESIVKLGKEYKGEKQEIVLKKWLEDNPTLIQKDDGDAVTFDEIKNDQELRNKLWDMCYTLESSISSIAMDDTVPDKTAMISQSVDQFKAAITAITKGGNEMPELKKAKEELAKAQEQVTTLTKSVEDITKENGTLKADLEKAKKDMKDMEDMKDGGADEDVEDANGNKVKKSVIFKSLPAAIQKEMEDNRKAIAKMQDDNLTREYISKAAGVELVGAASEIGPLLKTIAKTDVATADKVYDLFKTAQERIKEGDLLKEKGAGGGEGASALDKLNKRAAEYKAANAGVSIEKAFNIVFDTEHDLRKAYIEETRR